MPRQIEPVYEHLGALVRSHRGRVGISQEQLGRALDPTMTRASVANIEAGHQRVFLHTAIRLASVLGFELGDALLGRGGGEPDSNTLATELARKLPMSQNRARSLARRIAGNDQQKKP